MISNLKASVYVGVCATLILSSYAPADPFPHSFQSTLVSLVFLLNLGIQCVFSFTYIEICGELLLRSDPKDEASEES